MPDRPEVLLERMTWPEVEAAIAAGRTRALICVAATEQHGPHLPEGTDAWLGEELARRVAHALGDALVAPIIRPGCSEHLQGHKKQFAMPYFRKASLTFGAIFVPKISIDFIIVSCDGPPTSM